MRALVPPVPEQFGVERARPQGGPADPRGLSWQPVAHHRDEVGDVPATAAIGALRVVGRLVALSTVRPVTRAGLRPVAWS